MKRYNEKHKKNMKEIIMYIRERNWEVKTGKKADYSVRNYNEWREWLQEREKYCKIGKIWKMIKELIITKDEKK